ncbi:hypothetical protein E2562_030051 [Oryza meyeriana var. granulata]|uniref:Uncharacterized protein n=1 Tax=Oryza meyeriana var. granulata TaxID=110450 RepID=A0A6G1CKX0_9ORYZ|nr:hypothetical protein E2562_030051 [Oryza meyeriana var. granulata]
MAGCGDGRPRQGRKDAGGEVGAEPRRGRRRCGTDGDGLMAQGGGREEATSSGRRIGVGATDGSGRRGAPERREMSKRGGS